MPPRFGTLDLAKFAKQAGNITGYKTEPLTLKGVQILELHMEIDDDPADALLPKTMHPAIPEYAIFNVVHAPNSEWGPFTIAEVRVAGRTGVRPRGFVLRSYIDNDEAAKALSSRWGFPVAKGEVSLRVLHDRVVGRVKLGGKTVYEIEEQDRDSIGGGDIQYIASMHLARNKADDKLVLVQVDPEYVFTKAERGKPRVVALDPEAFGATRTTLNVMNPISACFTTADMTLPKVRYICNPELPALQGTTKVAA
ncbi:MAG TPA: acetoacetate decarboxylase family protein [Candidatus Binataceae bacterium]|nr:acetoacetate decarboxylase family protein [Candidatus Binataceae bacterium]